MTQQELFNLYVYVIVLVLAQSLLAWELGTKGWKVASAKVSAKIKVAILLFAGQVIWQRVAGLEYPVQQFSQAWPVAIPIAVFILGKLRPTLVASTNPRLRHFLQGKRLYYAYTKRLGVPFHELTDAHHRQARAEPALREAGEHFGRAIDMSLAENQEFDAALARYQLGMLVHLQGERVKAHELFVKALETLESYTGYKEGARTAAGCHYQLGLLAEAAGDLAEACGSFLCAYKLEKEIGELRDALASKSALERCGCNV